MSQLLVKTSFVTVPAGGSVVVTHGLMSAGRPVAPSLVLPDRVTPLVVTAANTGTYTVSNATGSPLSATFRAEYGYSAEVSQVGLLPMLWQGGAAGGGVTTVSASLPLAVSGPAATPTIALGYTANFTQLLGNLDLADTGVGAGGYGNAGALPESTFPTFTVDAKGRITAASSAGIQINGAGAKAYVDAGDASTLATANLFAQSLAFSIASKDAAHTATDAPLAAYTVDVTKKILTASAAGSINPVGGHTVVAGDRVLVKDETAGNAPNNGIYVVTTVGDGLNPWVLTRSADADSNTELCGALVSVETGTFAGTVWIFTANSATFSLGVTNVVWVQLSVPAATTGALGSIQLGGGLSGALSSAVVPTLHMDYAASGTLSVARGGTGASSAAQAFVFAGPAASAGAPTFRALVASDIPALAPTGLTPGVDGQFLVTAAGAAAWANPTAGGILAYTGSTYPNPTGLTGILTAGVSRIPLKPTGSNTLSIQVDGVNAAFGYMLDIEGSENLGVGQGGILTVRAGLANNGTGGYASLVGGQSRNGTGGYASVVGGRSYAGQGGNVILTGGPGTTFPGLVWIGASSTLSVHIGATTIPVYLDGPTTFDKDLIATGGSGTAGQALLSAGAGAPPVWTTITIDASQVTSGTLGAARGGTGHSSYTVGDILYASAAGVLTKLPAGASGTFLGSNGPGVAPSYQTVASPTPAYRAVSSAGNILTTDYYVNCTSGTFTLTLPAAATAGAGKTFVVKNSGTGIITIDGSGAETIDNDLTLTIATQYASYTLVSTGSNWIIV